MLARFNQRRLERAHEEELEEEDLIAAACRSYALAYVERAAMKEGAADGNGFELQSWQSPQVAEPRVVVLEDEMGEQPSTRMPQPQRSIHPTEPTPAMAVEVEEEEEGAEAMIDVDRNAAASVAEPTIGDQSLSAVEVQQSEQEEDKLRRDDSLPAATAPLSAIDPIVVSEARDPPSASRPSIIRQQAASPPLSPLHKKLRQDEPHPKPVQSTMGVQPSEPPPHAERATPKAEPQPSIFTLPIAAPVSAPFSAPSMPQPLQPLHPSLEQPILPPPLSPPRLPTPEPVLREPLPTEELTVQPAEECFDVVSQISRFAKLASS